MEMKFYTGIGSRVTPHAICAQMTEIARAMARDGFVLRSGGADGADLAFERGAGEAKNIYLPWRRFNGNLSPLFTPSPEAHAMAETFHGGWAWLTAGAQKLHARNVHQVLGLDLQTPSLRVVCWTPGGRLIGGTATAIKIALAHGIEVTNLGAGS